MYKRITHLPRAALAALLVAGLFGCVDFSDPVDPALNDVPGDDSYGTPALDVEAFTIYSQNVYLGGDTGPLFTIDLSDIPLLLATTNTFWGEVQSSRVPERMSAIVDEIQEQKPHLVNLQEVFQMAVVDATTGQVLDGADLLGSLQAEIQARGLPYEVVQAETYTSVTLPMEVDFTTFQVTKALSVTDRIAVLRRTDVDVVSSSTGTYAAGFDLTPTIRVTRGWIEVDVDRNGVPWHVFNTHLEGQGLAPIQAAQAAELATQVTADLDGVTVVTGDFNSDASGGPGDPAWTPTYQYLVDAGFTDAWVQSGGPSWDQGLTCCHAKDLLDPYTDFDQRLDLVLLKDARNTSSSGKVSGAISFDIIGTAQADRTEHGLWLSDHAGVVAGLRLPKK